MIIEDEHSHGACFVISIVINPRCGFIYAPYMMRDAVASLLVWLDVWDVESL